jgi:integrase
MQRKSVPKYSLHKASGQARVLVNGKHVYLGKFDSVESRQKYARVLAEMQLPAAGLIPDSSPVLPTSLMLVSEVLVAYLRFAKTYYGVSGNVDKEYRAMVDAIRPLNDLYGSTLAKDFGPLKLKAIRQHLIDRDLCRTEINKRVRRINRVFKWAVSEELIPSSVYEGLRTVTGLRFGKTTARESAPVKPVDATVVSQTLPCLQPQVAAMVQLQLLTGMRPSEVLEMRLELIDRSSDVWIYAPDKHKNKWRGHRRCVPLGPKAQKVIQPFMQRDASKHLFSPQEAEELRNNERAANRNRKTPVFPCELRAREKRREATRNHKSKRPKGDRYTPDSYRRAIDYGVKKANRILSRTKPSCSLLPSWTPYQLRHTYATEMRKNHGVEAAQIGLGHARTNVVDIYAEKNLKILINLASQDG